MGEATFAGQVDRDSSAAVETGQENAQLSEVVTRKLSTDRDLSNGELKIRGRSTVVVARKSIQNAAAKASREQGPFLAPGRTGKAKGKQIDSIRESYISFDHV